MKICDAGFHEHLSLATSCSRDFWAAIIPATFVSLVLLALVPLPVALSRPMHNIKSLFRDFLTLSEAEVLTAGSDPGDDVEFARGPPTWRTVVLSCISLAETVVWLGVFAWQAYTAPDDVWAAARALLVAFSWLYAALRPILAPTPTTPFDLFVLFLLRFTLGAASLAGLLYDYSVYNTPLPPPPILTTRSLDLVLITALLVIVLNTPLAIPSPRVPRNEIGKSVSPEDYTTLWGWASFSWVRPILARGSHTMLSEADIWSLSSTQQARPLFRKFSRPTLVRLPLLHRLCIANARDVLLDCVLTLASVACAYAAPFFLKRILDALDPDSGREARARAYVYAFLSFAAALAKAEADLIHMWHGRRASLRIRSELMCAIYDKALKRRDFSGVIDKPKTHASLEQGVFDPKPGADVGKIVQLMSADANKVANVYAAMTVIYAAPFELLFASVFLYQLMGWSAFAGFAVLAIGWPLNNLVAHRMVRIQKGTAVARDKRMSVLNELIGAVKFVKFFAWEAQWIDRVMAARQVEIEWMQKARVNNSLFSFIWTAAPVLVSVISFLVFVWRGNELTVGTAFTAVALFAMLRAPLNVIPTWIVQMLLAKVSMDRIAIFLEEDEVDEQVSSLKRTERPTAEQRFGIDNGLFKWNEVEEKDSKGTDKAKQAPTALGMEVDDASILVVDTDIAVERDHRFELRDITIVFPEGQLSLVTGPTGSGKTALLMALLGELTKLEGRILMFKDPHNVDEHGLAHTISYAAQLPWLRHQSIKENILFGHPYDEVRYNAVVDCCALRPDLDILEDGDETEIGARGITLSGGQKARVALARAVYAPSKYVLLDDPLSAVDSHTARFLFERLLCGPLLHHRTVVLVTHHVELILPGTQYLVRMLDGRIDTQGTPEDLRQRGVLDGITHDETAEARKQETVAEGDENGLRHNSEIGTGASLAADGRAGQENAKPARRLVEEEARASGGVKWQIYNTYLKASSYWIWIILLVFVVLAQFLEAGEKLWIKIWGEAYGSVDSTAWFYMSSFISPNHEMVLDDTRVGHSSTTYSFAAGSGRFLGVDWPSARQHPYFYIGGYAAITLATSLVKLGGVVAQYTGALRASRVLFRRLLERVIRAPMRWHDVTPQGRMLNRFSKDIETIDLSLAGSLQNVNTSLAGFIASVVIVIAVFPLFSIPAAVLGFFYYRAAVRYLNTGRDLRRMESVTRSPIFANFSEMLEGIVTVRAFSAEARFLEGLYEKIDMTTKMWYNFWMLNRWLLLYFDTLGAVAVLVTTLFALGGYVDAGIAGVSITSAMAFTTSIYWACRYWTNLELDLNSVERVVEYLDLPQEPPAIVEFNRPPAYWPSSSSENRDSLMVVEDLIVKYAPELPAVLHGISFRLKAKERVGLLGRTGSGKSTLAMSLLRFVDPTGGRIIIDGIDVSTIGLYDLRSRITFIPQDATLFSGTLRHNVDPFNEHTDAECLDVLTRVRVLSTNEYNSQRSSGQSSRTSSINGRGDKTASLATSATQTEIKSAITLDTQVSAGGTNFSQGQRQLIAMARALLRRSSIVVLDEATSSIDFATDATIQATIREEFGDSLLLTVAHRLKTVIDYDRLIVLDKGELAEFDTPWNLLQKQDGIFRNMCLKSGTFAELEAAAETQAKKSTGAH